MQNVLIVEDLPDVKNWLLALVQQFLPNAKVDCASTFTDAINLLVRQDYQLALLDIGLPDGSGLDILSQIKSQGGDCFCVITSIFDASEKVFNALKNGADGYILKSETSAEVLAHLQGIVAGKPPLSPAIAKKMLQAFRPETEDHTPLSPREEQMLSLIAKGYSVPDAADLLAISQHTAASYLKQVYKKLQVNNRADATLKAYQMGLVSIAKKAL